MNQFVEMMIETTVVMIRSAFGPGCVKTPNLTIFVSRITIPNTEKTA